MNIKRVLLAAFTLLTVSAASQAQTKTLKIAHINSAELMEDLPQLDTIKQKLETISKEYQSMLNAIQKELEDKQTYWESDPNPDETIQAIRQKQYQDLVTRYQTVQQEAQQAMQNKEATLMKPLIERLKKIIEEVAKEKGYTYVLDSSEGSGLIYGDPAHDLIEAVKERLK